MKNTGFLIRTCFKFNLIPYSMIKIIKRIIMFFLFGCSLVSLQGQEIVATAGNFYKNPSGSMVYTIGEGITGTFNGGQIILTQGMHQPIITITSINKQSGLNFSITAFPNPANDFIKLKVEKENIRGMQLELFDEHGKVLISRAVKSNITEIPMNGLSPSTYVIRVLQDNMEIKTFLIIKQ
jgi:hypothetical protein